MKNNMKNYFIYLLIFTFSLQSMASTMPKNNIANVLVKYDYLLTAHPQAHEEGFAKDNLKAMKEEIASLTQNMSKEELNAELETVLQKVPTIEQRVAFRKLIESSTPEQVAKFFSNPKLLQAALRGEGANFAMNWEENAAAYVLAALVLALVIAVIFEAIRNAKYQFFTSSSPWECSYLSEIEKNDLLRSALRKCREGANYPETCEREHYGDRTETYTSYNDGEEETYEDTDCVAEYRALKKVDK